jgi:hypothetical protein
LAAVFGTASFVSPGEDLGIVIADVGTDDQVTHDYSGEGATCDPQQVRSNVRRGVEINSRSPDGNRPLG